MSYKVVSVTPAGRKPYLEILSAYLLKNRNLINEHHFWINTLNQEDIDYLQRLHKQHPSFFKLVFPSIKVNGNQSIYHFFKTYTDPNTIYVRFDDDICWIADDAVGELINCRVENPGPFLIFANIINNAICTHLHQRFGAVSLDVGPCTYNATCPIGWGSPMAAEVFHQSFFNQVHSDYLLNKYKFDKWILWEYGRFSINCFAWFGSDMAKFDGSVGTDEEMFLSSEYPMKTLRPNMICGKSLVSHFAFHTQRRYLETQTQMLQAYQEFAKRIC